MSQLHSYKLTNMNLMPSLAMSTINLVPTCHVSITNCVVVYMVREPRLWSGTAPCVLTLFLIQGFRVGKNDPCVYVNPITKVRLVVVVDDILCRGSFKATEAFYTSLAARFKVQEPTFLTLTSIITYIVG